MVLTTVPMPRKSIVNELAPKSRHSWTSTDYIAITFTHRGCTFGATAVQDKRDVNSIPSDFCKKTLSPSKT